MICTSKVPHNFSAKSTSKSPHNFSAKSTSKAPHNFSAKSTSKAPHNFSAKSTSKAPHNFSAKNGSVFTYNILKFNVLLTDNIISFEQLGPDQLAIHTFWCVSLLYRNKPDSDQS